MTDTSGKVLKIFSFFCQSGNIGIFADVMSEDLILFHRIRLFRDRRSYEILFRRYYPILLSYAGHFLDVEDAKNIVQDVMANLWVNAHKISIDENLSAYLHSAVRNRCLNLISRTNVHTKMLSNLRLSMLDRHEDIDYCSVKELQIKIQKELEKLPPEQREAFEMSRFELLTYNEIASATGVSKKTVQYRIYQALKKLRLSIVKFMG